MSTFSATGWKGRRRPKRRPQLRETSAVAAKADPIRMISLDAARQMAQNHVLHVLPGHAKRVAEDTMKAVLESPWLSERDAQMRQAGADYAVEWLGQNGQLRDPNAETKADPRPDLLRVEIVAMPERLQVSRVDRDETGKITGATNVEYDGDAA